MRSPHSSGVSISAVVPCWNDHEALARCLESLRGLVALDEIIVADASPDDRSRELAKAHRVKVVECARANRGGQMNAGAAVAEGEILLFHHADTVLTPEHVESLREFARAGQAIGGAFHRKFDRRHPSLMWLERAVRHWSNVGGTFYGDQSIFVRRQHFVEMGGFAEMPLMEDVEFCRRLRKSGRTVLLDPPIHSSPRRHLARGAWRTTAENGWLLLLYRFGASPESLHGRYYSRGKTAATPAERAPATS